MSDLGPPSAPPPPPPPPVNVAVTVQPAKKSHWFRNIFLVVVVLGIIGAVAAPKDDDKTSTVPRVTLGDSEDTPFTDSNNDDNPPPRDVKLDACTTEYNYPKASGTLTNNSSKRSNYMIHVEFTDTAGVRLAEGYDYQNSIAPGQSAQWKALGIAAQVTGEFRCKIIDVERYAA